MTVERSLHVTEVVVPASAAPLSKPPSNRVFRFAADNALTTVHVLDEPGDCIVYEDLWFSDQEFFEIKSQSRNDAREWRRQGYSALLKDVYSSSAADAQDYITTFVQMEGHLHCRGLERYCCRHHGEERSYAKERARDAVLITQYRLQQRAVKDVGESMDSIASAYIKECREAKVFARRLGHADELVALQLPTDTIIAEGMISMCRKRMPRRLSNLSIHSSNTVDSRHVASKHNGKNRSSAMYSNALKLGQNCPHSPESIVEDLYAAIA